MLQQHAYRLLVAGTDEDDNDDEKDTDEDESMMCPLDLRVVPRHSRELMSFLLAMVQDSNMAGLHEFQAGGDVDRVLA